MKTTIGILALTLALAACTNANHANALRDREWTLVSVTGFPTMPERVVTPTIRFGTDGRMTAKSSCNSAGASYTADGDRLRFDAVMSTKRACAEQAGNRLETAYLGAIEATRRFRVTQQELELLDESGAVVARFR